MYLTFVYPGCSLVAHVLVKGLKLLQKKKFIVQDFIWIFPVKLGLFVYVVRSSWRLHQVSLLFIGIKLLVNSLLTGYDSV